MSILHLTVKKKWFDLIASGKKKIEYREVKPYWKSRLLYKHGHFTLHFEEIHFKNGYRKDSPIIIIEHKFT